MNQRLILLLIFCCFLETTVLAQTLYLKPHFGLKAGLNMAYTTYNPNFIYSLKFQSHPNIGFFYRLRSQKWVFQPELQLSVKGGTFKGETEVIRNNFNYFTVNPMLGYIVTEGLTFELGPEYGTSLNGIKSNGTDVKRDLGLAVGLRLDLLDFAEDFSINIRYIHGLDNVSSIKAINLTNRTLQVSAVYNLYRKK
jgi:Outer membrane protein beta-barrel domain